MEKVFFIANIHMNIVKNVDNLLDLVNLCKISIETRTYCRKYQREYFFDLIKKHSFRKDYYSRLFKFIESNDNQNFQLALNYYPKGEFYNKNFEIINKLQYLVIYIGLDFNNENWKTIIKFIFLSPDYFSFTLEEIKNNLESAEINNLNKLAQMTSFELGFHRKKNIIGFWDLETCFQFYNFVKFIKTDEIGNLFRINEYSFEEILDNIFSLFIFHLDIYKSFTNNQIYNNIMTILIKKIMYFITTTVPQDIDVFIPYGEMTLSLLYKLNQLDNYLVSKIVIDSLNDLYGLDINNYNENMEYDNYPLFEVVFNEFVLSQKGGSNCKSKKMSQVMGEFKSKTLKTRWGQRVTNPKQAIAIGLSMANKYCK